MSRGKRIKRPARAVIENLVKNERLSDAAIAARYGCVASVVWRWRQELGLRASHARHQRPDRDTLERLIAVEQLNDREIGVRYGCSGALVWSWRLHYRLPSAQDRFRRPDRAELARLVELEGWSLAEVATHCGCTTKAVAVWCEQFGIVARAAPATPALDRLYGGKRYEDDPRALREPGGGLLTGPVPYVRSRSSACLAMEG